jgi:hypothetical protein
MAMKVILDFCVGCGVLLPEGLGLKEEQICDNCGLDVKPPECRAQGVFDEQSAEQLREAVGQ